MKLGLALSGGGIRGIAHAGAIKALEDNGIKIDVIGGTSSGALVSSLYALGYSPYYIYILFKRYAKEIAGINSTPIISGIRSFMINKKIEIKGLRSGKNIEETYNCLALRKGVKKIEDIEKMPLVIPAVDVSDAKKYIFKSFVLTSARTATFDAILPTSSFLKKAVIFSSFSIICCTPSEYVTSILILSQALFTASLLVTSILLL